jgi:ketopantoate reductase
MEEEHLVCVSVRCHRAILFVYSKIRNCTIACWSTLLSSLVTALLDPAHAELNLSTWRALMTEYVAIAHACGISESDLSLIDVERELSEQVDVCRRRRNGEAPEHWPSMLLDRAQGKALEIEVVIGEVVRAGSAAGIACPRFVIHILLVVLMYQDRFCCL